jgi:hypothetical protein
MTTLFLGADEGLVRVELNGRASAEWCFRRGPVASVVPGYAATLGHGVMRSDDGGATWTEAGAIDAPLTWVVAVSPADGAVYVGTEPSALFRSEDGGRSFHELPGLQEIPSRADWSFPPAPDTHHVHSIAAAVDDPETLVVGIELGGVMHSVDGGETWSERTDADPDPHVLLAHRGAPGRFYEGGGATFAESRDGGASWRRDLAGIPEDVRYFYSLAVDPGDPDTMVISGARDPFSGHGVFPGAPVWSSLYRRSGDGPWHEVRDGLPDPDGTAMGRLCAAEPGLFFYVTEPGAIYRSRDAGETWSKLECALPPLTVRAAAAV